MFYELCSFEYINPHERARTKIWWESDKFRNTTLKINVKSSENRIREEKRSIKTTKW